MPTEPLMLDGMEVVRKSTHDLAMLIAHNVRGAGLTPEEENFFLTYKDQVIPALRKGFANSPEIEKNTDKVMISETTPIPDLSQTGPVFADWLEAREKLHTFLTGKTVKLRDLFEIPDSILIRNDIMPFFRPAGVTNRIAIDWKKKLGITVYEEVDVMKHKNSGGLKVPQLGFINRSVRPDENTLGENAKCPNDLIKVALAKNTAWLGLFGYSDADNLHFMITGKHLDLETWNWFPEDLLPGGGVAYGGSRGEQSEFYWSRPDCCAPLIGARLASFFKLKT